MPEAYCRRCHGTFQRPLPAPYGDICPHCVGRGEIVTLTDIPRARMTSRPRGRGDSAGERGRTRPGRPSGSSR